MTKRYTDPEIQAWVDEVQEYEAARKRGQSMPRVERAGRPWMMVDGTMCVTIGGSGGNGSTAGVAGGTGGYGVVDTAYDVRGQVEWSQLNCPFSWEDACVGSTVRVTYEPEGRR